MVWELRMLRSEARMTQDTYVSATPPEGPLGVSRLRGQNIICGALISSVWNDSSETIQGSSCFLIPWDLEKEVRLS